MLFRDLKYFVGCLPALICFAGLHWGGWLSPGLLYFGFVIIPVLELFVPASPYNEPEPVLQSKMGKLFYDVLLFVQLPLLYFNIVYFLSQYIHAGWNTAETIFSMLNLGVLLGASGINVAHELGHRTDPVSQWFSKALLLPALYNHYTLEHNYSHHLHVGTPGDAATARKNEPVYLFYGRCITMGYQHAWAIGKKMLEKKGLPWWRHQMIWSHIVQLLYLGTVYYFAGIIGVILMIGVALWGVFFLETVNYIEHYGLFRKKMPSGRYEPMNDTHSWNSNHELGRIMLFELVRHADHHYQTTRKYQGLRHLDQSPQLPFGYPMSILLALIPPLWFRTMNPRVEALQQA
jgi:alkane 1-monooxygenase